MQVGKKPLLLVGVKDSASRDHRCILVMHCAAEGIIRVARKAPSPRENNEKLVAAGEKTENKEKLAARLTSCCEKNRELEEEDKEHMVNGFGDRRDMSHTKGGNFYESGCINTNCLSGKVAKGATENIAKLNSSVDTSDTETEDEQYDFDISTSDTHFESDAEFHQDLDPTSDRKSEPLPSAILSPPRDSFELNTMVGQAQFG